MHESVFYFDSGIKKMGNNFQAKTEEEREFKKVFETINYAKNRE